MRVLSIDPGLGGAIAVVVGKPDKFSVEAVHDLPTRSETNSSGKIKRYIDAVAMHDLVQELLPADRVICERMIAPPGVSGMAAFSMGATMGVIQAVLRLSGVEYKLVSAGVWKRGIEVPADKEAARQMACRLFSSDEFWSKKKDHNRAEAALIGIWGLMSG